MKQDIEIAQEANIRPIAEIAAKLGIPGDELEMYNRYKAKIPLHFIDEERIKKAKLILVTAITPTFRRRLYCSNRWYHNENARFAK